MNDKSVADGLDELMSELNAEIAAEKVVEDVANPEVEDVIVIDEPVGVPEVVTKDFVEQKLDAIETAEKIEKQEKTKKTVQVKKVARAPKAEKRTEPRVTYKDGYGKMLEQRIKNSKEVLALTKDIDKEEQVKEVRELEKLLDDKTVFSQKKVCEKVIGLYTFLTGGCDLNTVLKIAFSTFKQDGYLEGGKKGNLYQALLKKPYSKDTANAQMGQVMNMLPKLGIAVKVGHRLTPDPESNLLPLIYQKMRI